MSLTAAASGFVVFLLSVQAAQSQNGWEVTYSSTQICALTGSTVDMRCTYRHPSRVNYLPTKVEKTFWFTEKKGVDLETDSAYTGRVEYHFQGKDCTLRIKDLRESDAAEYRFRFITNQPDGRYTGKPGVTLSVKDLQVQAMKSSSSPFWADLRCHSSCPLPHHSSYIWYKNGQKIQKETSSSYSGSFGYADSYSCALEGRQDFPSPSVCVYGQNCNRVTYSDRSVCAFKGSSVDISCTYNSYYSYRISTFWFSPERIYQRRYPHRPEDADRVQVLETEGGRSTLRITDLRESDSAEYRFKFTAGSFEWTSSLPGTTLTVAALQVQVTRLSVGQSHTKAELKCHSSCSPAGRLSYVWFKNGEKMAEEESSYKDWVHLRDVISCALKGREDYASSSVYAPKPPSVSVSPSAEIVEGSSVNLTCSSDANPAANYTWYKGKKTLLNKKPQLVFSSIQSSDSGEYYCAAENELGRRTSECASINVKYAPKTSSASVSPSGEIVEGSSVNLTCSSDANPAANYTWYKGNKTLLQGPQGSYHFTSISSEDRGIYSCKSENQHGELGSKSVFIDVQYAPKPPSVSVSPSAEIVEGTSVTLSCSSDANPAANYTWYKENEDSPKASGQNFSITDIRAEHSGSYYCEAQNRRGRHSSTLHLDVVAGAWKSIAIGATAAVVLTVLLLSVFVLIRSKKASKQSSEPGETRPDNRNQRQQEEQDGLHYASVQFFKNQADTVYSNIRSAGPHRPEDEDVEYSAVTFHVGSTAPRSQKSAVEDSAALYSTIHKTC